MHDPWLSGTGEGRYRVETRGNSLQELLTAAAGSLQFDLHGGDLNHILVESTPLKLRRFTGTLVLKNGVFEIQRSQLESASAAYSVKGTASWSRELDFTLVSDTNPTLTVTGTLASPKVSAQHPAPNRATLEH